MTQQSPQIAPINPFPKPEFIGQGSWIGNLHFDSVLPVIFTIVLGIWVIYTLVAAYHWIRYGHRSFLAIPLLVIHLMVSGTLILLAVGGMH